VSPAGGGFPVPFGFLLMPPHHRHLLGRAGQLLADGQPALAVVVAQTACEVFTEQLLTRLVDRLDEPLRKWVLRRQPRLPEIDDDRVRDLYVALSGDRIQDQPFWSRSLAHVQLRHQVVHKGVHVAPEQAEASCEAIRLMLDHLEGVRGRLFPASG
jgi:hypothetical protein